jgi:methylated-DNA-[protein]-cysteine S-methyltransferase
MKVWTELPSPVGPLRLTGDGSSLTGVYLSPHRYGPGEFPDAARGTDPVLGEAARQLAAYFAGKLTEFELPLAPAGTAFRQRVWAELLTIPYGTTISYLDLARRVADERAVRAVGGANGRNPISIIIPCHRVIGANGSLVGYGGGLERKRWLLTHEGALSFDLTGSSPATFNERV